MRNLTELEKTCRSNAVLKSQSDVSSVAVARKLSEMFGDMSSIQNVLFRNELCTYMDIDMLTDVRKTIHRLEMNKDYRSETVRTLRSVGEYFAFLAIRLNSTMFGHKAAFRVLSASVVIYDLCYQMLPYVFDDINFDDEVSFDYDREERENIIQYPANY